MRSPSGARRSASRVQLGQYHHQWNRDVRGTKNRNTRRGSRTRRHRSLKDEQPRHIRSDPVATPALRSAVGSPIHEVTRDGAVSLDGLRLLPGIAIVVRTRAVGHANAYNASRTRSPDDERDSSGWLQRPTLIHRSPSLARCATSSRRKPSLWGDDDSCSGSDGFGLPGATVISSLLLGSCAMSRNPPSEAGQVSAPQRRRDRNKRRRGSRAPSRNARRSKRGVKLPSTKRAEGVGRFCPGPDNFQRQDLTCRDTRVRL